MRFHSKTSGTPTPRRGGRGWLLSSLTWSAVLHATGAELGRLPAAATHPVNFALEIAPLLESSCYKCHGLERAKSGFRLDSHAHALAGGNNGVAIIPGDSAHSPLVLYVAGLVPDLEMPPKGQGTTLTPEQVGRLRAWIDQGAKWTPQDDEDPPATSSDRSDWWSLRPLVRPPVPQFANPATPVANAVDAFIRAKLEEVGLRPSPEADRRTLIRRLYFDLIGLPPKPADVEAFVSDHDPAAYEKLVDRLLASPQYGERWARHWLDVVHYGDTHGYDKDQPRPNAWPYRDYVIRSFNADKPYARFVQEQVAGDVLFSDTRDGFEALGFIAAGPWDLIGHAEVPESKADGQVARHLDRDDMVVNTIQTFNSLTVQCAQCHNHKFDPIAQEDYYALQAVFAAVDRADQQYDPDPVVARERRNLVGRRNRLADEQQVITQRVLTTAGQPLADLDRRLAALRQAATNHEAFGYHSRIEKLPDTAKWVQVDLGRPVPLARIVLHPCRDDFNGIGEGFGFPTRYKIELADEPAFEQAVTCVGDFTATDLPNPKLKPQAVETGGRAGRFIRVTATKLAPRQEDYIFALAELEAVTADGVNVAAGGIVSAQDSIEAPPRWQKPNLTDGWYPGATPAQPEVIRELEQARASLLTRSTTPHDATRLAELERDFAIVTNALDGLPTRNTCYVAAVYQGSGAFAGTGARGGQPRPIHVLNRGNVLKPGKEVGPGTLACLPGLPSRFELPPNHPEGERRAALARWLTRPDNPLTWRSIVNRVWQYHFGRGLVDTPNDFGRMGAQPTHPGLLDWLAVEFRDGGQSLKTLHRLIVTSATYRQESVTGRGVVSRSVFSRSVFSGSVFGRSVGAGLNGSGPPEAALASRPGALTSTPPTTDLLTTDLLNTDSLITDSLITDSLITAPPDKAPPTADHEAAATDSDNRYLWRQNRRKLEAEALRDSVLAVAGKLDLRMGGPGFQDFVVERPEHSPHYEYHLHDPEDPKSHRRSIYRFIVRSQPQPFMTVLDCADPSTQVARRNESLSPLQALALLNNELILTMAKHFAANVTADRGNLEAQVQRAHLEALGRAPTEAERQALTDYAGEYGLTNCCRLLFNLNEFSFVD